MKESRPSWQVAPTAVFVASPLTHLLVRSQSSPTTSLDSAMEEQGWDDDRRIIDWLGKPHHCPPGRASPEPIDARTNHGRTDADEEEIQRRVESQRKRCERRSTSPAPVPRPLLRQRRLIPSGTCTRAGTYWSRWSDSARRTWARWSRASNGTANHYLRFFAPFAHRLQSRSLVDEVGSEELHSVRTLASLHAAPLAQRHVRCRCSRERYEAP